MIQKKQTCKILLVGTDSPHLNTFVQRLVLLQHVVEIIAPSKTHIQFDKIHILDFSLTRLRNYHSTTLEIRRIAKKFQPDVVWLHQANSFSFFPVLALKGRFPMVLTVWGSDILVSPKSSFLIRRMTKFVLKSVRIITADSLHLAKETKKMIPTLDTPIHLLQFGINPIDLPVTKEPIFYSNRGHAPLYRIDHIIRAFYRLKQDPTFKEWKLVIAGHGKQTEELKSLVEILKIQDEVSFVGFLSAEENAKWYAKSTYFVSIPESDGTAVSLLEAMYYGCIPIVSCLPANREWITHGENGFIVGDLASDFLYEVFAYEFDKALTKNKQIINEHGTAAASAKKIQAVLQDLFTA